jgi:hypothetical protein
LLALAFAVFATASGLATAVGFAAAAVGAEDSGCAAAAAVDIFDAVAAADKIGVDAADDMLPVAAFVCATECAPETGAAAAVFPNCEVSSASIFAATDSGVSPELLFADSGDGVARFVAAIPLAGFEAALVDALIDGVAGCLEAGALLPDAAVGSAAPDVAAPFMLVVTLMLRTGRSAAADFAAADVAAFFG